MAAKTLLKEGCTHAENMHTVFQIWESGIGIGGKQKNTGSFFQMIFTRFDKYSLKNDFL